MYTLSVPSWVIPGTYLENLRFLAEKPEITGVELLFFFYNRETEALLEQEWEGIAACSTRFAFTAHLPDTLAPEHAALAARLMPLVRHCVLHPGEDPPSQARLMNAWFDRFGIGRFVLENTHPRKLEALLPLLPAETGLCMDCGHLLLEGKSPARFFERHEGRIREIHLHRIDRQKAAEDKRLEDHRPLVEGEPWYRELAPYLRRFDGIVNLEVFSWEEVSQSLAVLVS
ncbi:MAG: AP endonuclease [Spirochaetaceae bacterium]|jgi:sugar phosphate isomerase/epimerase|nr:AP endonuclease [Spirochaetaceae bacterium]